MLKMLVTILFVFFMLPFYSKKMKIIGTLLVILVVFPCNIKAYTQADIDKYLPTYQDAMKKYGVPASFMIKIGIQESGLGTSPTAVSLNRAKNMHGMSFHEGCSVGRWQNYSTPEDGIYDLARLLTKFDGKYNTIECLNTSKYPTRNHMIECLLPRMMTYAPPSENDTASYMQGIRSFMQSHPEYDEGLPSYEEAIKLREDTSSLPVINYGVEDGTCKAEYDYSKDGTYDPNRANEYGNMGITNFTTTYSGNINEGYIYKNQIGNALNINKNAGEEKVKKDVLNIINNIFANVSSYKNTSSIGNYDIEITGDVGDALTWKQSNSLWGSIPLGRSSKTISSAGCLATSVAIQIKLSGTQINTENFNPGTWVNYLNNHSGFSGPLFKWLDSSWVGLVPNWHYLKRVNLPSSKQAKIDIVGQALTDGYYPVICVKPDCGHWVAVTGVTDNDIKIADPGYKESTLVSQHYSFSNVTRMEVFQKLD